MFIFQLTLTEGTHAAHQSCASFFSAVRGDDTGSQPAPIPATADWNLGHQEQTSPLGHSESGLVWRSDPGWVLLGPKICPVYRFKDRHGRLISAADILRGSWTPMSQHTPSVDPRGREAGVPGNAPQWRADISKEHLAQSCLCNREIPETALLGNRPHFPSSGRDQGWCYFSCCCDKNPPIKAI